ncbi:MAG: hypothetical protein O2894_09935 [Planctomycetota bacterium]|nr:hypothetical protein [Planctomycetota bacterium]
MQGDEKLAKVLPRYEAVEQLYDGLNGKVIKWTFENGNTNHDPSILAFVVGADGKVFASMMNGQQYQAGSFTSWAQEQADAYERQHPSTRLPFLRGTVRVSGEGTDAVAACTELDDARAAKKPVLLYVGRAHFTDGDKAAKRENKLARAFEKGTLDSKTAAKEAEGWTLLRVDLGDEAHAKLAAAFGVTEAPALLLFAPGAESAESIDRKISGHGLAALLKKHAPTGE